MKGARVCSCRHIIDSAVTELRLGLGCLKLTKAMQKTSETLQIVADLYDDHVRPYYLCSQHKLTCDGGLRLGEKTTAYDTRSFEERCTSGDIVCSECFCRTVVQADERLTSSPLPYVSQS